VRSSVITPATRHSVRPVVNLNLSPAPKRGFFSKCIKERMLALIAKGRLRELLAEKGLRIVLSGAVDKTPSHRPTSTERTVKRSGRSYCRST
jgi:hypothetical protein